MGITNKNVVWNPSVAECYEYALKPEHIGSVDPTVLDTTITDTGALCCNSGSRTGRVPKDKRIVLDEETKNTVNWGAVNIPMTPESFEINKQRAVDYMNITPRVFVVDHYAGWDKRYQLKCRIISSRPYHALFMKNMLIDGKTEEIEKDFANGPDFTVLNAGEFSSARLDDVPNKTSVNVNFTTKE